MFYIGDSERHERETEGEKKGKEMSHNGCADVKFRRERMKRHLEEKHTF